MPSTMSIDLNSMLFFTSLEKNRLSWRSPFEVRCVTLF